MKWLLVVATLMLSGCATGFTAIDPEPTVSRSYRLNETTESTAGSPMIHLGRVFALPTFRSVQAFRPPDAYGIPDSVDDEEIAPDEIWVAALAATQAGGGYVIYSPTREGGERFGIHITPDGTIGKGWIQISNGMRIGRHQWPSDARFEQIQGVSQDGSFEAELVYSGTADNTLRLMYREYMDGLARPAFTQELTYNLAESKTITFKSLTLEILEAGNSKVRFRVVNDGGLPWLPSR